MRRLLVILAATVVLASRASAGPANVAPTATKGHSMGETTAVFLSLEPQAQQDVETCRQHPDETSCARLLAALDGGQRAEISTASSMAFTFDAGKLVKLTVPVEGLAEVETAELTKELGSQARKTTIPGQNILGAKWENYVFAWDTPDARVTLYQDNDPSLRGPRLLLVLESRSQGRDDTVSVKQLAASRNRITKHTTTSASQTATLQ